MPQDPERSLRTLAALRMRATLMLLLAVLHLSGCSFIYLNPPGGGDGCTTSYEDPWLDAGVTGGMGLAAWAAYSLRGYAGPQGSVDRGGSDGMDSADLLLAATAAAAASSVYGFRSATRCRDRLTQGRGLLKPNREASAARPELERDFLARSCLEGSNPETCNSLAVLWATGKGGPADLQEANRLFEAACDGGHMEGCRNLGISYANGIGVTKDPDRAKALFQEACDGGFRRACSLSQ